MAQFLLPGPPRHRHRCGHPVLHTGAVLTFVTGWLYWSISVWSSVNLWLLMWFDPKRQSPWSIPLLVLSPIAWMFVIPAVALLIWLIGRWRCGRTVNELVNIVIEPFDPRTLADPPPPGQPVMIERVLLTPEEAARRGLPGPVIVERIHYR